MTIKIGYECKMYRNTGTYAVPVWNEIQCVKDATTTLEKEEDDVTCRQGGGFTQTAFTVVNATIEFDMVYDTADDDFTAIRQAFFGKDDANADVSKVMDFAAMDGDITVSATQGLRAECGIGRFTRNERIKSAVTVDVNAKPTVGTEAPTWMVIA